jgi:hypothetical protein
MTQCQGLNPFNPVNAIQTNLNSNQTQKGKMFLPLLGLAIISSVMMPHDDPSETTILA